ncbi:MAG: isoamylase early set domain-containing protein [Saprospiraceae bacterium]|jgi:1,4-alpha-glucan branching enzyme|nr:isoamylase early set domain-containing protein [Saprospiraceae bacterium]MBK6479773.1 isoamylase early set domain-containing protein [Saprospiraceae bacterium]MBK6815353.1 isoamylase early set domain-containing protein [Saprospiraceae bacterium]MBK7372393.1 isoamylase early set domain-containing protein [Saprospiraceae bacterium]MBK7439022.1 isoamylase early set domain-containing protein [Saprospiraceae bacterium]
MAISKKYLKSNEVCKVTFKLESEKVLKAKKVELLGSFNNWKPSKETSMKKLKDGSFTKTVDLPTASEYQFRYNIDGKLWENESNADRLEYNGYGAEQNSVIVI